jgi:RHS repeat-associated protein
VTSCRDGSTGDDVDVTERSITWSLFEPPEHAPGEPHGFDACPDGACPRDQPAYLFSGEFHESVVDLRIQSCVGPDLVWARRYRSRNGLDTAQGNNWDFSYNIYIEMPLLLQQQVIIFDGNARPAVFTADAGVYSSPMYHRTGEFDVNGRFVLTFADGGTWIFASGSESADPSIRKLRTITDRNGNTIELDYDGNDRLTRVTDAVGRFIDVDYDTNGRIDSIEDSTGRTVSYEYYGGGDPGGNPGDLKTATRPTITGTVTNNDFPNGTTTTYTYSRGLSQPALNGNLLTIEDALQQVYLSNTYASTSNPADLEFDRLIAQDWGDPGDTIHLTYASVTPSQSNEFSVVKTWVNDRMGQVSEHFFNADNLEVIRREYTGFADPDQPTTGASNQPTGKLRQQDPTYFETRHAYNDDAHVVEQLHARGNITFYVYESSLDPQADPRFRGNLREVIQHTGTAEPGCKEATISRQYEYEPGLGNEHGELHFVTKLTDENGHITEHEYDGAGNRTATIHPEPDTREDMEYNGAGQITRHVFPEDQHENRRETTYTYDSTGAGCREDTIEDPNGLALTTTSEWDILGRQTRRVDARGNDKLYTYNAQDELIREEDFLHAGQRAKTDSIYDANMRLVQVDYEALDCDGDPMPHAVVSTFFHYDILGEDTLTEMEIDDNVTIAHEVQLDANRNPILVLHGEAVNQNDPDNTVTTVWDERGLPFRETRAAGTALASTSQHDYDENGNEIRIRVGLEGPERVTTHEYDCRDRRVATVDPMGNRTELDLDDVGNVLEQRLYGELVDVPGSTNNVLLERTTFVYDMMNRAVETTGDHFNPVTQQPIGSGVSMTKLTYDGESRVILQEDPNGDLTAQDYDSAGRIVQTVDPEGNIVELDHDENGNVVERTVTDRSTIDGSTQVGVWTHAYDSRNNLVESIDPMSNTRTMCYDSLGRMLEEIDARGNRTTHVYDGQGRELETIYDLTDDGTGSGTLLGTAVVRQAWDDNNRRVEREDPNGNVTEYVYDSLDRVTKETYADATERTFTYDIHDNVVGETQPNGTTLTNTWDGLERKIKVSTPLGIPLEEFEYDGRSLLVSATNDDTEITRAWDSLQALLSETQEHLPSGTPRTITYTRDPVGNATTTGYPSGRTVHRTFDGLRRTRTVTDGTTLVAELDYLCPNLLRRTFPVPDTQSDYTYDLAQRMLTSHHQRVGGTVIDSRTYAWDPANNKIEEEDLAPGALTGLREIDHDSLGRMVDSEVSGSASTDRTVGYTFDDAGNRTGVTGDSCAGTYTQTGSDAFVNQYTETPCEEWDHDDNGNVTDSTATSTNGRDLVLAYDYRDRLVTVEVEPGTQNEVVLTFSYDALGRKLHAERDDGSTTEDEFVYDDWNVIEEYRNGASNPRLLYLYGDDLDEHLELRTGVTGRRYYYYEDELGSTVAMGLLAGSNFHIERYAYHDYGEPRYFWNGSPSTSTVPDNPYLFAGHRWIPDAGLYDMRTRHLDTLAGRFTSRDSIGIWGDEDNLGNGYSYVANSPATELDPLGEAKEPKFDNCGTAHQKMVRAALMQADRWAADFKVHMNKEASRKRSKRGKPWDKDHQGKRKHFGKYKHANFNAVKRRANRISMRLQDDRIKIACRVKGENLGSVCKGQLTRAWTFASQRHATIRLCDRGEAGDFFNRAAEFQDMPGRSGRAVDLIHEVAHNRGFAGHPASTWTAPDLGAPSGKKRRDPHVFATCIRACSQVPTCG